MDLIEKSRDLLSQQAAYVAVRLYGASEQDILPLRYAKWPN